MILLYNNGYLFGKNFENYLKNMIIFLIDFKYYVEFASYYKLFHLRKCIFLWIAFFIAIAVSTEYLQKYAILSLFE